MAGSSAIHAISNIVRATNRPSIASRRKRAAAFSPCTAMIRTYSRMNTVWAAFTSTADGNPMTTSAIKYESIEAPTPKPAATTASFTKAAAFTTDVMAANPAAARMTGWRVRRCSSEATEALSACRSIEVGEGYSGYGAPALYVETYQNAAFLIHVRNVSLRKVIHARVLGIAPVVPTHVAVACLLQLYLQRLEIEQIVMDVVQR